MCLLLECLFLLVVGMEVVKADDTRVVIMHSGSAHARFAEILERTTWCSPKDKEKNLCIGGFARMSTIIKRMRAEGNRQGGPIVLFLFTGGIFTGTVWFRVYNWTISCDVLNQLKPEAIAVGTPEFDLGIEGLVEYSKCLKHPLLAANIDGSKVTGLVMKQSTVVTIKNKKIGIIGFVDISTGGKTLEKLQITDPVKAIQQEAVKLEKTGVDIIFATGSASLSVCLKIAGKIPQVDAVLSSGVMLWNGRPPSTEQPTDVYPKVVTQPDGARVPVGQVYGYAKYLGCLNVTFNAETRMTAAAGQPFYLPHDVQQDQEVVAVLDKYRQKVESAQNEVIGRTKVLLEGDSENCSVRECNLGNLIADAYVDYDIVRNTSPYWTHTPIGMVHAGSIKQSLDRRKFGGNITLVKVMDAHPFGNQIVSFSCTGETLRAALEASVRQDITDKDKSGDFLQFSGVQVRYDMTRPKGKRVTWVRVRCGHCDVPTYLDISESRTYNVVAPDCIVTGPNAIAVFKQQHYGRVVYPAIDVDIVSEYITRHSPITTGERENIVFVTKQSRRNGASTSVVSSWCCLLLLLIKCEQ